MLGPSKSTIIGRKIRFAVVGCGRISARHFEAIDTNGDDAELVAVCDVDKNKLETICEQLKVKGFDNLTDMLGQTQCDCVVLCTPSGLHSNQTIEIVQKWIPCDYRKADGHKT